MTKKQIIIASCFVAYLVLIIVARIGPFNTTQQYLAEASLQFVDTTPKLFLRQEGQSEARSLDLRATPKSSIGRFSGSARFVGTEQIVARRAYLILQNNFPIRQEFEVGMIISQPGCDNPAYVEILSEVVTQSRVKLNGSRGKIVFSKNVESKSSETIVVLIEDSCKIDNQILLGEIVLTW